MSRFNSEEVCVIPIQEIMDKIVYPNTKGRDIKLKGWKIVGDVLNVEYSASYSVE